MPPVAEAAALTVVASPATCEGSPACPGEVVAGVPPVTTAF